MLLSRFRRDKMSAGAVEYGLTGVPIAVVIILGLSTVGTKLDADVENIPANLERRRMDNAAFTWVGTGTCRVLAAIGLAPESCYNIEGRGIVGLVAGFVLVCLGIIVVWRRFL